MFKAINLFTIIIFSLILSLSGCQSLEGLGTNFPSFSELFRVKSTPKQPIFAVESTAPVVVKQEKKKGYNLQAVRSDEPLESFEIEDKSYADEATDFGFPPISSLIPTNYHEPVTIYMPGGKLISTYQLHKTLLSKKAKPIVINVLQGDASEAIPGSIWLSGAGSYGRITDKTQKQLETQLKTITKNDKRKQLIFYCAGITCWSSFNAALRAVNLGYRNVHWYRGGLKSWYAAGLPTTPVTEDLWLAAPQGQEVALPSQ